MLSVIEFLRGYILAVLALEMVVCSMGSRKSKLKQYCFIQGWIKRPSLHRVSQYREGTQPSLRTGVITSAPSVDRCRNYMTFGAIFWAIIKAEILMKRKVQIKLD